MSECRAKTDQNIRIPSSASDSAKYVDAICTPHNLITSKQTTNDFVKSVPKTFHGPMKKSPKGICLEVLHMRPREVEYFYGSNERFFWTPNIVS